MLLVYIYSTNNTNFESYTYTLTLIKRKIDGFITPRDIRLHPSHVVLSWYYTNDTIYTYSGTNNLPLYTTDCIYTCLQPATIHGSSRSTSPRAEMKLDVWYTTHTLIVWSSLQRYFDSRSLTDRINEFMDGKFGNCFIDYTRYIVKWTLTCVYC